MGRKYLLLYICLISQIAWSQKYLPVEKFTKDQGLSHEIITTLYQDKDGYLWIGTSNGLNKYNGYSFEVFSSNLFEKSALPGSHILRIFEDSENVMWCLSDIGISRYNVLNNNFDSYFLRIDSLTSSPPTQLSDASYNWKENNILLLAQDGLHKLDIGLGTIEHLDFGPDNNLTLKGQSSLVYNGLQNDFFIFSKNQLLRYIVEQDTVYSISLSDTKGVHRDGGISGVLCDLDGNTWVYSKKRIWSLDKEDNLSVTNIEIEGVNANIISVFQLELNELQIVTNNSIVIYNTQTSELKTDLEFDREQDENIQIADFLLLKSGIFWLGTSEGLLQFNEHKFVFSSHILSDYIGEQGKIKDLTFDVNGSLWLVSEEGDILVFDEFGFKRENLLARKKLQLKIENLNSLLLGDTILAKSSDKLIYLTRKNQNITAKTLFEGEVGGYCFSGNDSILLISGDSLVTISFHNRFRTISNKIGPALKEETIDIFKQNNSVFILQPYQMIKYSLSDSSNTILNLDKLGLNVLPTNTCFLPLNSRELILGTTSGLYVFYSYDFNVLPNFIDNSPISTYIYSLEKDRDQQLWITTESGLFSLKKADNYLRLFNQYEGLNWHPYGPYPISQSPGGRICISSNNEVVIFHPESLNFNRMPPTVELTELKLISKEGSTIFNLQNADTVHINTRFTLLQFSCQVMDFWDPRKNHYQYSLVKEGKQDKWIDLGINNSFFIARLKGANYKLKVRGSNSELTESNEPREIIIEVIAPFGRSRIAFIAYALIVVLLFYFSIFFTTRHLRKLNREYRERELIARKVEQQKEELTQKNKNITDSLNYAKRIQMALLPSKKRFSRIFAESFILHVPKDIVSGDFYWINEVDGRIYFAAVDCTGHGVPGAFMSIIGFELFRRITEQEKKKQPAEILNSLSQGFETIFRDIDNITLRDGMDVAFCAIDPKMKVLEFAGAFNPLYLIRDNTISEIKGDRFSVGLNQNEDGLPPQEFQDHVIQLKEGDVIYIFTDGYADQFGGPEGKKYKYRRFRHLLLALHQLPMDRQLEFLRRSIMDWKGDLDQVDDILVMGIRVVQED